MNISGLISDWNRLYPQSVRPSGPVRLTNETLRDGLQSPSVRDPEGGIERESDAAGSTSMTP